MSEPKDHASPIIVDQPIQPLRYATQTSWVDAVMADFDTFMQDHAAAEKKASGMAMSMISHYPDRTKLVEAMSELAVEELSHFREVVRWIHRRGSRLAADQKDAYVVGFRKHIRQGKDIYFLDRLIIAGIIEARGCERFGLVADALQDGALKRFYSGIARSEQRHLSLFDTLAKHYFNSAEVDERTDTLLDIEAEIIASLPICAALH